MLIRTTKFVGLIIVVGLSFCTVAWAKNVSVWGNDKDTRIVRIPIEVNIVNEVNLYTMYFQRNGVKEKAVREQLKEVCRIGKNLKAGSVVDLVPLVENNNSPAVTTLKRVNYAKVGPAEWRNNWKNFLAPYHTKDFISGYVIWSSSQETMIRLFPDAQGFYYILNLSRKPIDVVEMPKSQQDEEERYILNPGESNKQTVVGKFLQIMPSKNKERCVFIVKENLEGHPLNYTVNKFLRAK